MPHNAHTRPQFALTGAGSRGRMFATLLRDEYGPGVIVAVAEPRSEARRRIAEMHDIPESGQFDDWQSLLAEPKKADILIDTTMDRDHVGSACAAMRKGYDMLLEKPLASTFEECFEIDRVRRETGRIVGICHSLRHLPIYERVQELLSAGTIGDVVSIDQLEAVENIHQSHSFVRGNWGNEARSAFMLLAKSCHDIDIIASLVPRECLKVSSFGSLTYFRKEYAPDGAPEYCVQGCPVEESCPYHAMKVYGPKVGWRNSANLEGLDREETRLRLLESPYGRCVFQSDNDVVDHQVVAMEFEGGVTSTFTMTAFTPWGGRYLRVHGTRGYLEAKIDQGTIDVWEFWHENRHTKHEIPEVAGAHGGADQRLLRNLIDAVIHKAPEKVRTNTAESLRTHSIVFAAERARREGRVVALKEFSLVGAL